MNVLSESSYLSFFNLDILDTKYVDPHGISHYKIIHRDWKGGEIEYIHIYIKVYIDRVFI